MGVVYKARDSLLKNFVAVKMLRAKDMTPEEFLRFQLEAKAAGNLNHPNIVTIYTFGMDENLPYMVMEFVQGESLSSYIQEHGPLTLEEAMPIFTQICDGMSHAHKKGVIHRDLKSSNILLTFKESEPPVVHILDFGIAKIESDDGKVTKTGQILGSPRYMSPEQFAGKRLDARSDVYSLGCIIFETLTGKPPFSDENILNLKRLHESAPIPDPQEVFPDGKFSASIKHLLRKALAKTPASRYQRMSSLKGALLNALYEPDETGEFRLAVATTFRAASQRPMRFSTLLIVLLGAPLLLWRILSTDVQPTKPDRFHGGVSEVTEISRGAVEDFGFPSNTHPNANSTDETAKDVKPDVNGILDLAGSQTTDSIVNNLPTDLKGLYLDGTQISDDGIARIAKKCRQIGKLHLLACPNISDKAMDAISMFPHLTELHISMEKMTSEGIRKLGLLSEVTRLDLQGNPAVTDDSVQYIGRMKSVKYLSLVGTRLSAKGIAKLYPLKLHSLDLTQLRLHDDDLPQFKNIDVDTLNLSQNELTPRALDHLAQFPHVRHILLRRVPDISIEHIEAFEKRSHKSVGREEM